MWLSPARVLRQVIPERCEDHSIDSVGLIRRRTAGPRVAGYIRELRAPLHATFRSVIDAIPEASRTLDQHARVGRAAGETTGQESSTIGRDCFREAAGVAEVR